jgi:methyl-accepting chemotaxis protein
MANRTTAAARPRASRPAGVQSGPDTTSTDDMRGKIAALDRSLAVVEFSTSGIVLDANQNFLTVMGYTLDAVRGQHHSMFVDAAYRASPQYREFWERLGRGEFDAGQYKRIANGGREVWLQASYNPVLDATGRVTKVVKYATDVTAQTKAIMAINETVARSQELLEAVQRHDLSQRLDLDDKDGPVRALCVGVNGMLDVTTTIVAGIRDAAETIATAAREIAAGNTSLSHRTEEQASSLQQTAASLEQLTTTVKQNADSAHQANKLAASASDVAVKGGNVIKDVVQTMDAITQSSRKISEIISVIDEIAFQTNILALNAAVEAARAGEQGRGFAVVAAEVRNLAQRSANAAKEIKALISDSVAKVDTGSKLVETAGQTMDDILSSVGRVTDIMSSISAASQEQSLGIQEVNNAVAQMDKITQQNAAFVEQAAATATSMDEQTANLLTTVRGYRLPADTAPSRAQAADLSAQRKITRPIIAASRPASPPPELRVVRRANGGGNGHDSDWKEF